MDQQTMGPEIGPAITVHPKQLMVPAVDLTPTRARPQPLSAQDPGPTMLRRPRQLLHGGA
ncbi:MAG: hypothetical protein ACYC6G_11015 [Desulfobaccales bacterium]